MLKIKRQVNEKEGGNSASFLEQSVERRPKGMAEAESWKTSTDVKELKRRRSRQKRSYNKTLKRLRSAVESGVSRSAIRAETRQLQLVHEACRQIHDRYVHVARFDQTQLATQNKWMHQADRLHADVVQFVDAFLRDRDAFISHLFHLDVYYSMQSSDH